MEATQSHIKTEKIIPELRFQSFEDTWHEFPLNHFMTFKNGLNADKEKYGSGIKFINVLDIISSTPITYDSIIGSVEVSEKEFEKNKVEYGDVVFQRSSETREEVGQSNVYLDEEKPAVFGGFVIRGKKLSDYHPLFFNAVLKTASVRKDMTSRSGGSTRYNIGQDSIGKVQVSVPSLPEQQKIASFLSAVDEKIQQLSRKKALLEQYKKGVMQQIFSQQIRFKDENGNPYPDWEENILEDCLDYEQPTKYSVKSTEYDDSYETPVLTAGKSFILGYTDEIDNIFTNHPVIIFDDFTTSSQYVDFNFKVKSSAMKILHAKEGFNTKFLFEALRNIKFEVGGHGRHWISIFSQMVLRFPCFEEQQQIYTLVDSLDRKIADSDESLKSLTEFKKGLLQKMFV